MRPTKATVNLSVIAENLRIAQRLAPQSKIMAVIKANAYGHGVVEVARELQSSVPAFAVAFFDEAVQLRDAGITRPILILQGTTSESDVAEASAKDFWLMMHSQQQVERVLHVDLSKPVQVWIKVNTGMNRLGLSETGLEDVFESLSASGNVHQDMVLCSHLACADELNNPMTMHQVNQSRTYAKKYGLPLSIANSAGIMGWPQSHAAWNRPGYMLYGNTPFETAEETRPDLIPAMSMDSEIISIRHLKRGDGIGYGQNWVAKQASRIGTIPIGYGDGYPRHAKNGTPVLVNGRRVPLAGRVSMDMISVDISKLDQVELGDPVELWGENISVNEVAKCAGTIGYEILAGLTGRVPVIYTL
jgi:alanine racemase